MGNLERLTDRFSTAFLESSRAILLHFANISIRYNYMYIATPKVACSSILQTLQRLELGDASFLHDPAGEIHDRRFSPLLTPLQIADFYTFCHKPGVTNFCFVRNPFDRLLSCYLEKVRDGHLSRRFLEKLSRDKGPVLFSEFLEIISTERTEEMESHYAVQYLQTFQDYIPYNFIGRFENLEVDLTKLGSMLSVDLGPYLVRVDPHKTGAKDFSAYFDAGAIKFVCERYYKDFEAFGYPMGLPI